MWPVLSGMFRSGLLSAALLFSCAAAAPVAEQSPATLANDSAEQSSARAWLNGNQTALLDAALENYRELAARGGWLPLDPAAQLSVGMRHPEVRLLRQRLRLTGEYTAEMGADPLYFDAGLHAAVQRFQQRHGLRADGRVSGQTLVLLNLPVETRIEQLEYARTAWASLPPRDTTARRVWVNVPEAAVSALVGDEVELHMRAVVGHPSRPTPTLSSAIRRIVVNPTWTIPQRIAGEDLLPRQRNDAGFFPGRGIQIYTSFSDDNSEVAPTAIDWSRVSDERFPYRLRQQPGPANSLGRYKFEFPNDDDIYLHDTPARALLGLSVRSLSSGCVRAQDSQALAQWLLNSATRPDNRTAAALTAAASDPEWRTRSFVLPEQVPVDLVYLNAWVAGDGELHFRHDIYQRAAPQMHAGTAHRHEGN